MHTYICETWRTNWKSWRHQFVRVSNSCMSLYLLQGLSRLPAQYSTVRLPDYTDTTEVLMSAVFASRFVAAIIISVPKKSPFWCSNTKRWCFSLVHETFSVLVFLNIQVALSKETSCEVMLLMSLRRIYSGKFHWEPSSLFQEHPDYTVRRIHTWKLTSTIPFWAAFGVQGPCSRVPQWW